MIHRSPTAQSNSLLVEQLGVVSLRSAEMNSARGQRATAVPVGKQAKVSNLHEADSQNVEKEAPDRLVIQSHRAFRLCCCESRKRKRIGPELSDGLWKHQCRHGLQLSFDQPPP